MPPQGRKAVYNTAERALLDPHKENYQRASTPEERKYVAQEALASLFNYWASLGINLEDRNEKETRTKRLIYWMQNSWRKPKVDDAPGMLLKIKPIEVLWQTRRDDVFAEIAHLLGIESADTTTPGWLNKRMEALKNVMDSLSVEERAELDKEHKRIATQGYPEDVKRRIAERSALKRLDRVSQNNWLEMGLLTITVVTRSNATGQIGVDIHDNIAAILGVPAVKFEKRHKDLATEMKRNVGLYVKSLKQLLNPASTLDDRQAVPALKVELDSAGFPKIQASIPWAKCKKRHLEDLLREYISQHYYIASAGRTRQAPYQRMEENISKYVDAEYLPSKNFKITDPRTMKRDAIIALLNHIIDRQRTYDLPQVFSIKHADEGRKRNLGVDSNMRGGVCEDQGQAETAGVPARPARAKATLKGKQVKRKKKTLPPTINAEVTGPQPVTGAAGGRAGHRVSKGQTAADDALPENGETGTHNKRPRKTGKSKQKASGKKTPNAVERRRADLANAEIEPDTTDDMPPPPRPRPKPKTKKKNASLNPAGNGPDIAHEGPDATDERRRADLATAEMDLDATNEMPPPPRPRPKPKPKKSTASLNPAGNGGDITQQVLATNTNTIPDHLIDPALLGETSQQMVSARPDITQEVLATNTNTIPDHLIDPVLLGEPSKRPAINTSDNLALQEANQYMVTGKRQRVPKKRL